MAEDLPVLFVHGLWMTGLEGLLLRHRLAADGFAVETLRYGSTTDSADDVIARLSAAIGRLGPKVRLLGHSLGGLLILRCLEVQPQLPVGPVVLLGSPVNGSEAARGVANLPGARWLMGGAAANELLARDGRTWQRDTPIGVIAGDVPLGLASLVSALPTPHDGAVSVAETRLQGATASRVFHVNHMGLLASAAVAQAASTFLSEGRFRD